MGDIMRPVPFKELAKRIFSEYRASKSIFGIPEVNFFRSDKNYAVFGESCGMPAGPAAGPHTQLAQNIISSYLSGGRFIELKTVQIMDTLEIEKPCIDAEDEGYNTEWSSEFTLEKSYNEYIKAWIILHLLEIIFDLNTGKEQSFIFNMSVGYDLKGITSPEMDNFINSMTDSSSNPVFLKYIEELKSIVNSPDILKGINNNNPAKVSEKISANICKTVTLSTMHGCPPEEIEAICSYMIKEKRINTFVKLNPTLLGFNRARTILNRLGFGYIELSEDLFNKDLQYNEAVLMLKRLKSIAEQNSINFGIKLTNTLGTVNTKKTLPGNEMYMSGRALFPLSINLAADLAEEFNGSMPVSYSGGASALNIREIFETGIRPVTMATELLKPGGYMRMKQAAEEIILSEKNRISSINTGRLRKLAEKALTADYSIKKWRGTEKVLINNKLPLFDCFAAPCVEACPIHQDIPEYIKLTGGKKYSEALALIFQKNALPSITGHICDHQCMYNCTRLDYEGAVEIREMKKEAVQNGWEQYRKNRKKPEPNRNIKAAVIGAGPAGLSAACFLAEEGFHVTVFEKEKSAGGVVKNILPGFRIPAEAVERDIKYIKEHGVVFKFGVQKDLNINKLKKDGFKYICIGIGAEKGNILTFKNSNVLESLEFLKAYKNNPSKLKPGKNIAVIGGGNTAMDSARAAKKLKGVEKVIVLYRRTEKEMPADREEYEEALKEGVKFHFLRNPEKYDEKLTARVMKLGKPDKSGRPRPVPTEKTEEFEIDTLITAIGEHVDNRALTALGLNTDKTGKPVINTETLETELENVFMIGDARTGPSSIVRCIADARKAVNSILKKENIKTDTQKEPDTSFNLEALLKRKGRLYTEVYDFSTEREASRCLECSYLCGKCVDVCPNRANIAVKCGNGFRDIFQIVHIDSYCNECGNCATFCPYEDSAPYRNKLTLFNLDEDFTDSSSTGFLVTDKKIKLRINGEILESAKDNADFDSENREVKMAASVINTIIKGHSYLLGPVDK